MITPKLRSTFAENPSNCLVFWLVFFLHGAFIIGAGRIISPDSGTYSEWADQLISSGFNFGTYLRNVSFVIPPVFYLGWVTFVAICKVVFGSHWSQAVVFLNLLADCGLAVMVVCITKRVTHDHRAAWLALLLYCVAFDIFNWPRYILTESTFLFLSFAVFAAMSCLLLSENAKKRSGFLRVIAFGMLSMTALFWRPTGIVMVPLIGVAMLFAWRLRWCDQREERFQRQSWQRRAVIVGITLLAVGGVLVGHAALLQNPKRWPLKTLSSAIQRNAKEYHEGIVVYGRPDTYHAAPVTIGDYASISLDRFMHFFYPIHASFSLSHKLLLLPPLLLIYLLIGVTIAALLLDRTQLKRREEAVVALALCWVFMVALFHGMTQLDYDWRYRAPVLPQLIFLAAVGFSVLMKRKQPTNP